MRRKSATILHQKFIKIGNKNSITVSYVRELLEWNIFSVAADVFYKQKVK